MAVRGVSYPTFSSLPTPIDEFVPPVRRTFSFDGSPSDVSPLCPEMIATAELSLTQSDEEASSASVPSEEEEEGYVFPELRSPPISKRCDTVYLDINLTTVSVHGPVGVFAEEKSIIKKYPVRYIDCGPYKEKDKVVAVTKTGKHVVWQQAIRSCVPTAISMIALDRQKTFLARELRYGVTGNGQEIVYMKKAGFQPIRHELRGLFYEKVQTLQKLLLKTGPGILHLIHPELGSHVCVLDEISWEALQATVRDSIKGEMITIRLFPFAQWIGSEFFELAEQNLHRSSMAAISGYSPEDRKRKTCELPVPAAPKLRTFTRTESRSSVVSTVGQNALNASSGRRFLTESYDEINEGSPHFIRAVFKLN